MHPRIGLEVKGGNLATSGGCRNSKISTLLAGVRDGEMMADREALRSNTPIVEVDDDTEEKADA